MMMPLYAATQRPCLIALYDPRRIIVILPGYFHHWQLDWQLNE
jgi:hypothetical protein